MKEQTSHSVNSNVLTSFKLPLSDVLPHARLPCQASHIEWYYTTASERFKTLGFRLGRIVTGTNLIHKGQAKTESNIIR
jgi:hypothetical protein